MSALAPTLEAFFTERLIGQRHASPHTVAAYRDAWRLLLRFVRDRTGKEPCELDLTDLDATIVGAFLDHLEQERRNSARTRNARLAAIRSLFRYAALRHPEHAGLIARVLAIPAKRCQHTEVSYLTRPEVEALVAAPDRNTWNGRRDHALLDVAAETGLRVSELTGLRNQDVELGSGPHVRCTGKGRNAGRHRCPNRPWPSSKSGCANAAATPPTRCSPPAGAPRSAVTPSKPRRPAHRRPPPGNARLFAPSTRRLTSFGTAVRWSYCAPKSMSR